MRISHGFVHSLRTFTLVPPACRNLNSTSVSHISQPWLGEKNLTFNSLDKACSLWLSDIIQKLASLAEQVRSHCWEARGSRSSGSLGSPSVHALACSSVCWKLNWQKTSLCWRTRVVQEPALESLHLRMPGPCLQSLYELTTWTCSMKAPSEWEGTPQCTSCLCFDIPYFLFGFLDCRARQTRLFPALSGPWEPPLYFYHPPHQLSGFQLVSSGPSEISPDSPKLKVLSA